jgi:hypothetical protein
VHLPDFRIATLTDAAHWSDLQGDERLGAR